MPLVAYKYVVLLSSNIVHELGTLWSNSVNNKREKEEKHHDGYQCTRKDPSSKQSKQCMDVENSKIWQGPWT